MFAIVSVLMARNFPSLSRARSILVTWSRPCASEMNDSERFAVHLTARLSFLDANVQNASSA